MNSGNKSSGKTKKATVPSQIYINKERCKGCGYCIEFCPKQILCKSDEANSRGYHTVYTTDSDKCTGCDICSMVCPDFAISRISIEKNL